MILLFYQSGFIKTLCSSVLINAPLCYLALRMNFKQIMYLTMLLLKIAKKKIFQADNKLDFSLHLTSIINKKKIKLNNLVRVQKYMTPGQRTFLTSSFIKSLNLTTVI